MIEASVLDERSTTDPPSVVERLAAIEQRLGTIEATLTRAGDQLARIGTVATELGKNPAGLLAALPQLFGSLRR